MPSYKDLNPSKPEGERTIQRLLELRKTLTAIPERTQKETLLLATWNIREFDSTKYGPRMKEALYYIAEIIAKFDLIALQEVNKNLDALEDVMKILGGNWAYVITDTTEGTPGNDERLAFVYDTRKVKHSGLAGELVIPPIEMGEGAYKPVLQLYRTPFLCGFTAGWCDFMLATVHILWGPNEPEPETRIEEIRKVAQFLKNRTLDETAWARNLVLLGDFNIWKPNNNTFKELEKAEFVIPEQLRTLPSNVNKKRHYDQIAFRVREDSMDMTGKAGIFDFYQNVYREEDRASYEQYMPNGYWKKSNGEDRPEDGKYDKKWYYRMWRTYQMSDHFPMWVELKIDYSDEYLTELLEET
jgi:hypothetical protein